MPDVSADGRNAPRDGPSSPESGSPHRVLYVTRTMPVDRSAPSVLDATHGMDVRVVYGRPAVTAALDEDTFDCVVVEDAVTERAGEQLLADVEARRPDVPVIVYAVEDAATNGGPTFWFGAGADDYLSATADTDSCVLLARRIDQCVASRRAHADRRQFRTAVEQVDRPVLIAGHDGWIEHVNPAFETLTGYDRADLRGRSVDDLYASSQADGHYQNCWETVSCGDVWEGTLPVAGADGSVRSVELTVTPVSDATDRVERVVAVGAESASLPDANERQFDDFRRWYRQLIDTAPDAILVADADTGEIVEANETAATLLGRPRCELVGTHQSDLHPDDERERYRRLFDRHRDEDASVRSRFEDEPLFVETATGERVPVEINASVIELDDRTLFQGHFRDVSERRDRDRKLRAILESIPDVAIVYDEAGTYREVLTDREDLLTDSPDVLEGTSLHDALPPEPADRLQAAIRETVETGERRTLEYRLPVGDEVYCFEARIAPLRTDVYESECVLLLARDITERERREQDLRSFREAVEHAGHVIMVTDTDGTIEYVNPAFENVTGYAETEALGRTPSLLSSGAHDETYYRTIWETLHAGEVWEGELINERADGERYHIEQTIAPIVGEAGSIERFVAVNTDITERKRYERQLERERDRLEEFAETVAHDLRNPLSIAIGHVDVARERTPDETVLTEALSALERMESMIDEMLTLSKQGETVREPESVRFDRIVDAAWDHVAPQTATRSDADDLHGWTLRADESRLRRLLENLFQNAATHGGRDVTVRVGRLSDREGFFVEDDGPGVPADDRNRVFESGFTSVEEGTGFGLAIVKQIVDAHGWTITVADADDGSASGARFEIETSPDTYAEEGR